MKTTSIRFATSLLFAALLLLAGCKTPAQKSVAAYKDNMPKFKELLPQWQKFVPDSLEENFTPDSGGVYRKGKVIFLQRELDRTSTDVPLELSNSNIISDNHEANIIAVTPEEVGTLVLLDIMTDQSKQYSGQTSYVNEKIRVFMIDAATGEVKKRRELKLDKFDPPSTLKSGVRLSPTDAFNQFVDESRKTVN